MTQRKPFGFLDEAFGSSRDLLFVRYLAKIHIDIIESKHADWVVVLLLSEAQVDCGTWPLGLLEMVLPVQPLHSLHAILHFELNFGILGIEGEGYLIYSIRSEAKVRPPQH